ncbi:Os01g0374501 [Oryza sativa Japonica Group]|uniref:Os01g0374501 protein n=2 Tax=Oryza sativa TaxID=4530 RepID=A0A0P0V354_ORYSJ|nr:hypothetical protein OsI_01987 [Oryza sativa Indica Group]KAB8081480.1 hypothetical protein EE612_002706 [Oryza sativa]KAF2950206.1 hypothetical protein DAI22_01g171800 [Oryza sativa Japonica Group]BAS72197.1 Os01g0374501 [Oryza sativa Japonica Group]
MSSSGSGTSAAASTGRPHQRRHRLVLRLLRLQAARGSTRCSQGCPSDRRRVRGAAQDATIQGRHCRSVPLETGASRLEGGLLQGRAELGWTEAQVKTAAAKIPTVLMLSVERLRKNWEFLTKEVGMDAERVANFPVMLS